MATSSQRLAHTRVSNPDARAIFDYLLTLRDDGKDTLVETVAGKTALPERVVRDVFRLLQTHRLGRLVVGRKGAFTRFVWGASIRESIPARRRGEQDAETAASLELSQVEGVKAVPTNVWTVKLPGRRVATLLLPISLTRADLSKVRDFCEALKHALPA